MRHALVLALILLLAACKKEPSKVHRTGRTKPVCATQDCATKTITDNGCADDGSCLSCVNMCPSDMPSASP